MYRPMGMAQDVVSGEAVMLLEEDRTGTIDDAEVHKGVLVTTPSPSSPPTRRQTENVELR